MCYGKSIQDFFLSSVFLILKTSFTCRTPLISELPKTVKDNLGVSKNVRMQKQKPPMRYIRPMRKPNHK